MIVGVLRESFQRERRVALVPTLVSTLVKASAEVLVEAGAGAAAGFPDAEYEAKGARMVARPDVFSRADVILMVRTPGANPTAGAKDIAELRDSQILIGFSEPLGAHNATKEIAGRGASLFAMELMPRITRAQSMDALSSMATVTGYKAALLAATELPRMFPMMMTAAGTIAPSRVFVIGAGVAGLQAIASSRRLGAKVEAYDVRPAVKEQIESLGARFVELAHRKCRRRGQGRLRDGAGRSVLSEAARAAVPDGGRERRGHHDRVGTGQEGPRAHSR